MTFGFDFRFFWEAASEILRGGFPYNIGGFFHRPSARAFCISALYDGLWGMELERHKPGRTMM